MRRLAEYLVAGLASVAASNAQSLTPQMRDGISGAQYVPSLTDRERADAVRWLTKSDVPPRLGETVSVTPNAPFAKGGAHLSFWKTSFVLGTADGGEAGVNFWNIHTGGHINVGFTPDSAAPRLLDCRLLTKDTVAYVVYAGDGPAPLSKGRPAIWRGHRLLIVSAATGIAVSVELWPSPDTAPTGFLGCEITPIE